MWSIVACIIILSERFQDFPNYYSGCSRSQTFYLVFNKHLPTPQTPPNSTHSAPPLLLVDIIMHLGLWTCCLPGGWGGHDLGMCVGRGIGI